MLKREQLKDDYLENRLIRRRLVLAAVFSIVLLSIVLGRLYVLQIVEHEHFSTLSDSNRIRIKALPPTRGLIYDRHGIVMADNLPAYRLEIVREQVSDLESTLQQLKQYVDYSDQDLKRFQQSLARRRPFESIPLRLNLNDEEVARMAVNLHKFEGVEINARLTRNYPQGAHAIHALGYVGLPISASSGWKNSMRMNCTARSVCSRWKSMPEVAPCACSARRHHCRVTICI